MNDTEWPTVLVDDDGIRPAGQPDECFYCSRRVGEAHGHECVTVSKRVEHRVTVDLADGSKATGLWQFDEPHFWDDGMSEFHKNDSSWCAGNILKRRDEFKWDNGSDPWTELSAASTSNRCPCSMFATAFVRVVDATPRIKPGRTAN